MTDAAGPGAPATPPPPDRTSTPRPIDIQRPLEESMPAGEPAASGAPATGEPAASGAPTADAPAVTGTPASDAPAVTGTPASDAPAVTGTPVTDPPAADAGPGPTVPLRPAVPITAGVVPTSAAAAASLPDGASPDGAVPEDGSPEAGLPERVPPLALVATRGVAARAAARAARAPAAAAGALGRAGRAVLAWTRRPTGRLAMPGLLIVAMIGAAGSAGAFVVPTGDATTGGPGPATVPPAAGAAGVPSTVPGEAAVPSAPGLPSANAGLPSAEAGQATPPTGPTAAPALGNPAEVLAGWAQQVSVQTGIPVVAVQAYGYAQLVLAQDLPGCQLKWTTLAGIGRIESNHGSSGGATLLEDGRTLPMIRGLPLDGQGDRKHIADTDAGLLDNDDEYDRAVGPMQFIPQTWYAEADPSRGIVDINNINDAALAAGYYLCRDGRNLSDPADWWNAILSYNHVQAYANAVFAAANEYGQRSRGS